MEKAISHYFGKNIKSSQKMPGGFSFDTRLVTLNDDSKFIFRAFNDYVNSGGRMISIIDTFEKEKYFYDTMNTTVDSIFPHVFVIDDSKKYYEKTFQIYEYIEGVPLSAYKATDAETKSIHHQIGVIVGKMHNTKISPSHKYIEERGAWNEYMTQRIYERLFPLEPKGLINRNEVSKIKSLAAEELNAEETLSFLHLDMRYDNIIYNAGKLFVIDAENAEWGDPYFELARLDVNDMLTNEFLEGYLGITKKLLNLNTVAFKLYSLEVVALVLNVIFYEVDFDSELKAKFLRKFEEIKNYLICKIT